MYPVREGESRKLFAETLGICAARAGLDPRLVRFRAIGQDLGLDEFPITILVLLRRFFARFGTNHDVYFRGEILAARPAGSEVLLGSRARA